MALDTCRPCRSNVYITDIPNLSQFLRSLRIMRQIIQNYEPAIQNRTCQPLILTENIFSSDMYMGEQYRNAYKAMTRLALNLKIITSHHLRRTCGRLHHQVRNLLCKLRMLMITSDVNNDACRHFRQVRLETFSDMFHYTCAVLKGGSILLTEIESNLVSTAIGKLRSMQQ